MPGVEWAFGTDRQADAVQRQWVLVADQAQVVMKGAAGDHVVFSVDLEEADVR
ncbi:hypothetical protein D3C86_2211320 [compost metagenome]